MSTESTPTPPKEEASASAVPADNVVVTKKSAVIGGRPIQYTVTAGTLILKEEREKKGEGEGQSEGEKPRASVFFVAYTMDGVEDATKRPLTFSFNGGPGSSSVWMHLGLLGPRRVKMGDAGALLPPPFGLEDNDLSILDKTDLVFIDPVGTGYSRPVQGEVAKEFFQFRKDIESVGDFIRLYATRKRRWLSPKYLIGESYGTMRAAGVSSYLQDRHGMFLNGLMLVSSILDYGTVEFVPGNDLPYVLYLPSYAAIAWYHGKAGKGKSLRDFLDEAEDFASGEYARALFRGTSLKPEERKKIARKLAAFTGLTEDYVERSDFRFGVFRYAKELLRQGRRTVGRLDGRFTGVDRDAAGEFIEYDPSMAAIMGPYSAALNDYVRGELGFESDLPYEILSGKTHEAWSNPEHENRHVETIDALRKAICANPDLRVFVANGYYDLATPYFATEYTFDHLGLDHGYVDNVRMEYYEAGHMMYVHRPSLEKLKADLARFLEAR